MQAKRSRQKRLAKPHQTVAEVEGWSMPMSDHRSGIVEQVEQACSTPVSELGTTQVSLLLRQDFGVDHILSRAIELVEREPLAEDDYGLGAAVLVALLGLPPTTWRNRPDEHFRIKRALDDFDGIADRVTEARKNFPDHPEGDPT